MSQFKLKVNRTTTLLNLVVTIGISGTAVNGVDYEYISGADSFNPTTLTVTIPASQSFVEVIFNSLANVSIVKNLTFTVINAPQYQGIAPLVQNFYFYPVPVGDVLGQVSTLPEIAGSIGFRLDPNWTGHSLTVRHATTTIVQNINYLPDGSTDEAALLAFANGGTVQVVSVPNEGTARTLAPNALFQNTVANQPIIVENGVLVKRHGRLAIKQTGIQWMEIPTFTVLGSGVRPYTINYVAGLIGTRNDRILITKTTSVSADIFILGWSNGYKRVSVANNIGNPSIPPAILLIASGRTPLECYSTTTQPVLTGNSSAYKDGVYFNAGAPSSLPSNNLSTNGRGVQNLDMSDCYFSEFMAWSVGDSILPALKIVEESQRIRYGLSTPNNKFFSSVIAQLDFNDTGNSPYVINDRSLNRFPVTIAGTAQISSVDPQFGSGCLLLSGGSSAAFNVQLPVASNELIIQSGEDFAAQIAVRPTNLITAGANNVFVNANGTAGLTVNGTGNLGWFDGAQIALETGAVSGSIPTTDYTLFTVRRINNILTLWKGVTLVATSGTYANAIDFRSWKIGVGGSGIQWNGRVDNFRLSRGNVVDPSVPVTSQFDFNTFN